MSTAGDLEVRRVNSVEEADFAMAMCLAENWPIAIQDMKLYYATDPNSLYLGEVAGEKVSFINSTVYGDDEHCFIGCYVVKPEHRMKGKGYGLKTWDYAWSRIPDSCSSISLCSTESMASKYEERYGFKPTWEDYLWVFTAEKAASLPVPPECSSLIFTSYKDHDFDSLLKYDTSVFGYRRESFMIELRVIPDWEGWVTSNSNGEIVGYCVVKKSLDQYGWLLSPWYANDISIARALLNKAAIFALNQSQMSCPPLLTIVMPEVNKEGTKLAYELAHEPLDTRFIQMFARSTPKVIKDNSEKRVFGMSSTDIG